MSFRNFRQAHLPAVILSTMVATLFAGVAGTASAASGGACPGNGSLGDFLAASNVAASFSNSGLTTTYTFISLTNENPVGGVPGLVKYCVYPSPDTVMPPTAHKVLAANWNYNTGSDSFSFVRPGGNKSNIPLDGTTTVMGTATWDPTLPTNQTILLHISDPTVCNALYGGDPGTCWVKPALSPCATGDTTLAYNAMPFGVVNCGVPAEGFECCSVNEFGDAVALAGTARTLDKLEVAFGSYACQSGHWNTADCVTTGSPTFTHDITANIYAATCDGVTGACLPSGPALATVTTLQTIPYRPSADAVKCPTAPPSSGAADGSQWWNPNKVNDDNTVGGCQNSIITVLTFDFASQNISLPADGKVIWTVAFNTSTSGYSPLGTKPCSSGPGGCPYDSLNVGDKTFAGAPYSGVDIKEDLIDWSQGGSLAPLTSALFTDIFGTTYRPLGAIFTK